MGCMVMNYGPFDDYSNIAYMNHRYSKYCKIMTFSLLIKKKRNSLMAIVWTYRNVSVQSVSSN